jgi:hypothetical protein
MVRTSDSEHEILPPPQRQLRFRLLALRCLTAFIGCVGLAWGFSDLLRAEVSDDFRDLESRLLQFQIFSQATATETLATAATWDVSPCDNHAQRALLLLEIPVADAALRSGTVHEYDERIRSLEARGRQALSCTPRDSFVWLVLFGLETGHGVLSEHAFDLLAMSYETSPNEAWIATRRTALAIPVVLSAPEPIRQKILTEFQNLVRHRFAEMPARSYLRASAPTRALLQSQIEQLDASSQRTFSDALQRVRS